MTSPGTEALREAARVELARVYGNTCPETWNGIYTRQAATEDQPRRLALVTALRPAERRSRADRVRIEQAIASGWTDARIVAAFGVSLDNVAAARAAIERSA